MKNTFLWTLACCCMLSCTDHPAPMARPVAASQDEDSTFVQTKDTFSTKGPHSITRSLLLDKSGKLWFASWQGAMVYDGHLFTNITLMEGMKRFHIFSLLEDSRQQLWFGSILGGVFRYDPVQHTAAQFSIAEGLAGHSVLCMLQDRQGYMWFGTIAGLSRCAPLNPPVFTNYTTLEGLNNNSVNALLEDRSGKLWIGTNGGLCYYDPAPSVWGGGKSFTPLMKEDHQAFNNVRALAQTRDGTIWIACEDGLWCYNKTTAPGSLTQVRTRFTSCVFEDRAGRLWISEWGAKRAVLSRYDGKTFKQFATSVQIFGIAEDRQGAIWYGTERGARCLDLVAQNG